jgi:hypothetical protein
MSIFVTFEHSEMMPAFDIITNFISHVIDLIIVHWSSVKPTTQL